MRLTTPLNPRSASPARSNFRRHHGRKRQRDDAGDEDRARQRERKFAEQRAGQSALQRDRRINGRERDRHGDDRADQFARAEERRIHAAISPSRIWRSTFSTTTMASSTTNPTESTIGEQREQIEREAEHLHQKHRADQRNRNRHHGTSTERNEPRNKKMTIMTMSSVSVNVLTTS